MEISHLELRKYLSYTHRYCHLYFTFYLTISLSIFSHFMRIGICSSYLHPCTQAYNKHRANSCCTNKELSLGTLNEGGNQNCSQTCKRASYILIPRSRGKCKMIRNAQITTRPLLSEDSREVQGASHILSSSYFSTVVHMGTTSHFFLQAANSK